MRALISLAALLVAVADPQVDLADLAAGLFKSRKESVFDDVTKGGKNAAKDAKHELQKALTYSWFTEDPKVQNFLNDEAAGLFRSKKEGMFDDITKGAKNSAKDAQHDLEKALTFTSYIIRNPAHRLSLNDDLASLFRSRKEGVFDEVTKGSKDLAKHGDKTAHRLRGAMSDWLSDQSSSWFRRRTPTEEAMHKAKEAKKKVMKTASNLSDDTRKRLKVALDDMETAILNDIVTDLGEDLGAMHRWDDRRSWSTGLMDLFSSKSTEEKIRDEIIRQFTGRSNTMDKLRKKIDKLTPSADRDKLLKDFKSLEKSFEDSVKSLTGMLTSYNDDL
eukprot:Blabericola_migrator_1__12903@NODE_846_length_6285_cov_66_757961_g598_i0_p2_GENE_NODE_846_length_6285_cov_66_757961_g598_i0NODE_846_length_6285_cov_66_757961_g598_i0_p2_ORF_typecomplete_len332_score77_224HB_MCP_1/PF12729_7/6_4e024HB_MCP_1/PF12729_7/0_016FAA_hydrolase_N/PF09298_11/9_3FAA_hydrolase_N/PF09298_11/2_3FAA_hydrolase_N/PF09298_11/3_7e03DUF4294/PF14127_6/2_2e02DUF4294/PF14127_6/0_34Glutaredoxin2_C/PF04399_13/0_31Glutaredoxin2_C/PF04399_13/9e02Yuri_gagarin/PF15934_5/1_5e03Yuri_gagarin/PF1